jgi:hypothetical protein
MHLPTDDQINPAHYRAGSIEVIDVIREQLGDEGFIAYCRGNLLKYAARAGKKDATPQDLAKAAWYGAMAAHVGDATKYHDPRY